MASRDDGSKSLKSQHDDVSTSEVRPSDYAKALTETDNRSNASTYIGYYLRCVQNHMEGISYLELNEMKKPLLDT